MSHATLPRPESKTIQLVFLINRNDMKTEHVGHNRKTPNRLCKGGGCLPFFMAITSNLISGQRLFSACDEIRTRDDEQAVESISCQKLTENTTQE